MGLSVAAPVSGVAAKYAVTGTAAETTDLVVSDETTTVTIASATYTSIAEQVNAIQGGTGYDNLKFTVSANASNNGFIFQYKTTGAVGSAPTLTGTGSSHLVNATIPGVSAVNSATTTTINISTDTPAGVVKAINEANTGVTASLVDTGVGSNSYRIILTGQTGSNGVYTVTSSPDLGFHDTANTLQVAQDAVIGFDGLTLTRSSNTLTDVVNGATLNLLATSGSSVTLNIINDKSTLKTNVKEMVSLYNDLLALMDNFTAEKSDTEMSGYLAEDTAITRFLKTKIRSAIFGDSSTGSGNIMAMRDIGVNIDQNGNIKFSEADYDAAIAASYDDVVIMLTGGTSNENLFTVSNKGLAQDVATVLSDFIDSTGVCNSSRNGLKIRAL